MADYLLAFPLIKTNEGEILTDDKTDSGGLTYYGISKVMQPQWEGWSEVKRLNLQPGHTAPSMLPMVHRFYKQAFWDKIRGDEMNDQEFAEKIFDTAVNIGLSKAIKLAYESVGLPEKSFVDDELIKEINS